MTTQDPEVVLEERREGYFRYRRLSDGKRWEVFGECECIPRCLLEKDRADCIVGAILKDGTSVDAVDTLKGLIRERGMDFIERLYGGLDSPIVPDPDYENTCCKFTFAWLPDSI